jgi:hypothetical protein
MLLIDGVDIAECTDNELSLIRSERSASSFMTVSTKLDSMSAGKRGTDADLPEALAARAHRAR